MTTGPGPVPGGPYAGGPYAGPPYPGPPVGPPYPGPPGPGGWHPGGPHPAPPGWGAPTSGGAPAPRPRTVTAGIAVWAVGLGLSAGQGVWSLTHVDQILARARAHPFGGVGTGAGSLSGREDGFLHTVTVASGVFGLVWALVYAAFLVLAWQGRNWARVVVWVLGGLAVFGLAGLLGAPSAVVATLLVLSVLCTLAGIVLLALRPSNDWYRRRGWELRAGR